MANKTIEQVENWFKVLGIDVTIKFTGKSITINNQNFRLPAKPKNHDYEKSILFDEKVIGYVRSLFPEGMEEEISSQYEVLVKNLKSQDITVDFRYANYGAYAVRDIKQSIDNAKRLLAYVESQPNFYEIIGKYEAYRHLVDRSWSYIEE